MSGHPPFWAAGLFLLAVNACSAPPAVSPPDAAAPDTGPSAPMTAAACDAVTGPRHGEPDPSIRNVRFEFVSAGRELAVTGCIVSNRALPQADDRLGVSTNIAVLGLDGRLVQMAGQSAGLLAPSPGPTAPRWKIPFGDQFVIPAQAAGKLANRTIVQISSSVCNGFEPASRKCQSDTRLPMSTLFAPVACAPGDCAGLRQLAMDACIRPLPHNGPVAVLRDAHFAVVPQPTSPPQQRIGFVGCLASDALWSRIDANAVVTMLRSDRQQISGTVSFVGDSNIRIGHVHPLVQPGHRLPRTLLLLSRETADFAPPAQSLPFLPSQLATLNITTCVEGSGGHCQPQSLPAIWQAVPVSGWPGALAP